MRKEELFEVPPDEPEMLHSILSKLPKPLNLEQLISQTVTLFEQHPPETLGSWRGTSRYSTLRTARSAEQAANQSLSEGAALFENHARQLERDKLRQKMLSEAWKYRRPAATAGLAICVGILSWWLRRSSGGMLDSIFHHLFQRSGKIWAGKGRMGLSV